MLPPTEVEAAKKVCIDDVTSRGEEEAGQYGRLLLLTTKKIMTEHGGQYVTNGLLLTTTSQKLSHWYVDHGGYGISRTVT